MRIKTTHPLDVSVPEAREWQERLRRLVSTENRLRLDRLRLVAGTDISYLRESRLALGAVVLMRYPSMEVLEMTASAVQVSFPYVPGLLSFRELPALLPALEALEGRPQLVLVDGQGLAHPKRFGLASHLGVLLDVPTVGCAKSRLVGEAGEPGGKVGDWVPLLHEGDTVGAVLRTREKVKPLYVSIGHMVDLPTAVEAVLSCLRGTRLPEPQKRAHSLTVELKRAAQRGRPLRGRVFP
jgi:deoxyribonuclease V